jgi:hypothetical protein
MNIYDMNHSVGKKRQKINNPLFSYKLFVLIKLRFAGRCTLWLFLMFVNSRRGQTEDKRQNSTRWHWQKYDTY